MPQAFETGPSEVAVTLKDVAARAGVSRSAVSRTYTEGASVSAKTRAKVEAAAKALGYRPNALASSLTTGRTKLVGLVSDNFQNPIFLQVFDRFTKGLQDRGLRPLLVNLTNALDPEESIQLLKTYSVDGVIVASSTLPVRFAEAFGEAGLRVVHSFGRHRAEPLVDVLGIDNNAAGRMAAQTLLARGYRRLAFLGGPESATSTQDRLSGFLAVLDQRGDVTVSVSFAERYAFDAGRREMLRLLEAPRAEAYFCGDDVLSIGALSALQTAGLSVPEDVGIIGLNDMEMAGWQNVNLTTIHNPIGQIINASVDLIAKTLNDPAHAPQAHLFACHIVERGTLRPVAGA